MKRTLIHRGISYLASIGLFRLLADKPYLKLYYWARLGKRLPISRPQSFSAKTQWLKLYGRRHEYIKMVDKYAAKEYIAEKIGAEYVVPLLGAWDDFAGIDFCQLPDQFVLKTTHDSGGVIICRNKQAFDVRSARKKLNKHLKRKYYFLGREWPYKYVKPRIIAEKYLTDESGKELKDYKVHVFNGVPRLIHVDYGRFVEHKRNFYTPEWQYCHIGMTYPNDASVQIERPERLDLMLELSRIIAKDIPYLRVDFYSVGQTIYLGEMTLYSNSGYEVLQPEEYDMVLGGWLDLPSDSL